ncbi:MAG TPA: hypothetical protein VLA94_07355 [Syntrophales bacterium]|nr:hypothetical protein [Syntrophales bacterium]
MKKELKKQIDTIERLKGKSAVSAEFSMWRRQTEETLKALYGEGSPEVQDFNAIYYSPVFLTCRMGDEAFEEAFRNGLDEAEDLLKSALSKVRLLAAR